MKRLLLAPLLFGISVGSATAVEFAPPVRLKAGDSYIRVESPGWACPCWAKIKGKQYLLVGQFKGGKIRAYEHLGGERFAPGTWLQADKVPAKVPDVW